MKTSAIDQLEDTKPQPTNKLSVTPSWVGSVPQLKPGTYDDGLPFHQVQYLCCKMMLRPNHFVSRARLFDFGKVTRAPAAEGADHLRDKLTKAGDRVKTTDDFITGVASKSYLSGKPYLVKFPDGRTLPTGEWLRAHLAEMRKNKP